MSLIKGYPTGSDRLMLLNTIHHRAKRGDNGKYGKDAMSIVYQDLVTKEKKVEFIESPEIDIYVAKPDVVINDNIEHIELDKVTKFTFPFQNILLEIAKLAGQDYVDYYWNKIRSRNFSDTKSIHKWRRVFGSDWDIDDFYRYKFYREYEKPTVKLSKGFLDIEIDIIDFTGTFPNVREPDFPVTAISLHDQARNTQYTLLLRNHKNPLVAELEANVQEFKKLAHDSFCDTFGHIDYKIFFFDDEAEMIKSIFSIINRLKIDFVMAWNMAFDIPYLVNRLKLLGWDPEEFICHKDFKVKECYYYIDDKGRNGKRKKFADRGDFFKCSSYTTYIDQMILYATIRKGTKELESMKLEYIANLEIGEGKLNFDEETNLRDLPYVDYVKYVLYNIKDTLLQLGIETKTEDVENLYDMAYDNCTRYHKAYRQSIYIKNRSYIFHIDQGYIMGNNTNVHYEYEETDDEETDEEADEKHQKFQGAIVGDPELNLKRGIMIHGKPSKYIFTDVMDADYASLYPHIIYAFNICASTQWGKIVIKDPISPYENLLADPRYDRGAEFMEDFSTGITPLIGQKWFNLPSIGDIYRRIKAKIDAGFLRIANASDDNTLEIYNSKGEICDILYVSDTSVSDAMITLYVHMLDNEEVS